MSGLRILVLTDRQWASREPDSEADPLRRQVRRWAELGNPTLVLARSRRGAPSRERPASNLEIRRAGGRLSVCLRAGLRTLRGAGRDADVVLEVVDRIAFLTPLWWWIDAPQVTLVHHLGADRAHLGMRRRVSSAARRLAIRLFYGHHAFMVVTPAAYDELIGLGVPPERVSLAPLDDDSGVATLEVLGRAAEEERARLIDVLRDSPTGTAAGLAIATMANNAIQLIFVIVFARLLGADGYGALAALVSAFLILMVTGQSVQAAAAREATLGAFGDLSVLRLTLQRWARRLVGLTIVLLAVSILFRDPLATVCGVEEHPWAATAVLPAGALWMLLSLQRGALQGLHSYAPVGYSLVAEAAGRVICGLILVAAGAGVTGAFLGTPLAFAATAVYLGIVLSRRLGPAPATSQPTRRLRTLVVDNRLPIFGLLLLAVLQNVDVIVARHEFAGSTAGSYAAAAVAAKSVVWVAIGVGLQVLPEATRRAADGDDPRPVLLRALAVLAAVAGPALVLFALAPKLILRAFGNETTVASDALPLLGLAMTLLAIAYLTVQYAFALGEWRFIWVLLPLALLEPPLLMMGDFDVTAFAGVVLALQFVAASLTLLIGLTTRERRSRLPAQVDAA